MKSKKILTALLGMAIGFINGLLGAGGGMLAVPLLKKYGFFALFSIFTSHETSHEILTIKKTAPLRFGMRRCFYVYTLYLPRLRLEYKKGRRSKSAAW